MGIITQYESDITGVKDGFLDKVGTDPLDTDSQILSGAVNELNDEINDRVSEQYVAESINTEELYKEKGIDIKTISELKF